MAVFERLLRLRDVDRVVVSRGPLAPRLERWVSVNTPAPAPAAAAGGPAPKRGRPRPPLATAYVAPASEPQRALAAIWEELLGIERIGIHDNFFELGGHSLFAARVLSRVKSGLKVSLPLEAIFEAPTIAELASRLVAPGPGRAATGTETTGERVEIEI